MFKNLLQFLSPHSDLTISQRNIPLSYLSHSLAMFILIMPVRILWMQQVLTNAQISILTGTIFLSVVLLELPTGAFADLVGKKLTVQVSFVVYAIAMMLYLWAESFWQFGLAVLFQGMAEALRSGADSALIFDSLAEDGIQDSFRKVNGKQMSYAQFSMVAATFLGGWLGSISLSLPFIVFAVLLLISAGLASLMKEPAIDTEKFTFRSYVKQTKDGTKHLFHSSKLIKLTLLYMLVGGIGWTFQRLLRDMVLIAVGYDQFAIGVIGGSIRLLNILFLAKVASSVRAQAGGWDILLLPLLMFFSYTAGFWLNPLTSLPIVAGMMMIGTGRFFLLSPYLQHEITSKYRATAMSAANLLVSLLLVFNMFTLGFFLDQLDLSYVMVGFGLVSLLVVVPLALAVRKDFIL